MKQVNRYRVYGAVTVDVYMEIDAPSIEEALEYAEDNCHIIEYANGTVGIEDDDYNFGDGEITCCCEVEWEEAYSEMVEEDVDDDNMLWNTEEDDEKEDEE